MTPRIFIGSSVQSLRVAHAIQEELEHDAEVTVWSQGIFRPMRPALGDLVAALDRFDFGVFVFTPDDIAQIKNQSVGVVRDNVVFELGLFVGRHGRARNFFVVPRRRPAFRLPSDLTGITPATYDADRRDQNLRAALGPACTKIRHAVRDLGPAASADAPPPNAPLASTPPADAPGGRVPRPVDDAVKNGERPLHRAFGAIQAYFEQAALALRHAVPHARVTVEADAPDAFGGTLFFEDRCRNRCTVWICDLGFGTRGIAYAERRAGAAPPELLTLTGDDAAAGLHSSVAGRLSLHEAAERLWTAFVSAL